MPRQEDYAAGEVHGALWTPQAVRHGLLWQLDAGDLPTLTLSSGTISTIASRGTSSATMDYSNARPDLVLSGMGIGRRPCARFASSGQRLLGTAVTLTFPCVMVMTAQVNTGSGNRLLSYPHGPSGPDYNGGTSMIPILLDNPTPNQINTYYSGAIRCGPTAITMDTPQIISVSFSSGATTNIAHWVNGAAGATGSMTSYTLGAGQFATGVIGTDGASGSAEAFIGDWGTLTVYCADDAGTVRQRLEGWHAWRWGLQNILAASHPYRNAPPLIGG